VINLEDSKHNTLLQKKTLMVRQKRVLLNALIQR